MPRSVCFFIPFTSSAHGGFGFPSPACPTIKSTLTLLLPKEGFLSPLFKEGVGEIFQV
jgi:hypothetical protein